MGKQERSIHYFFRQLAVVVKICAFDEDPLNPKSTQRKLCSVLAQAIRDVVGFFMATCFH